MTAAAQLSPECLQDIPSTNLCLERLTEVLQNRDPVEDPNEQSGVGRLTRVRYGVIGFVVRHNTETLSYT